MAKWWQKLPFEFNETQTLGCNLLLLIFRTKVILEFTLNNWFDSSFIFQVLVNPLCYIVEKLIEVCLDSVAYSLSFFYDDKPVRIYHDDPI